MVSSYLGLIEQRLGAQIQGDVKTFFDFASGGAKRMDRLITDLLRYSRIGQGERSGPVPLAVADAMTLLSAEIRNIKAVVSVDDDLPTVEGDPAALARLFQNLIGNAIKFRAKDRDPRVEIGWRRHPDGCLVWVRDNGIGIAAQDHARAFEVFQRLVSDEKFEGSGIGLSVCRKIVEHLGGRIWIDSEPEAGSTVFTLFP